MTKELLIENLQAAMDSCGLEFHIVFNDNSIKFARLKDDVAEKLKNQFLFELNSLFLDDTGYSLRPVQEADDNLGNVFYYFDNENLFENLRFMVDFSQQESTSNFSFEEDSFEGIKGFIIKLSNADKSLYLYKKHYPINYLQRASVLRIFKSNDKLEELQHDILNIDKSFDFVLIDGHVVITKMKTIERFFGYEDYIKQSAIQNIAIIEALAFIEDVSHIRSSLEKTRIAKKLNKAMNSSPVLELIRNEKENVLKFIEEHPKLKDLIKFNEAKDKVELTSLKSIEAFVKLLDDDYLKSELTKMLYDSQNKDVL